MRFRIAVAVVVALLLALATHGIAQDINDAFKAFSTHKIQQALELFESVFANSTDDRDRIQAASAAAVLNWRYYGRYDDGRRFLEKALELGTDNSGVLVDIARLERNAGQYAESLKASSLACILAEDLQEESEARTSFASTIVLAHSDAAKGDLPEIPAVLQGKLAWAHKILQRQIEMDPGDLQSSKLLLLSSILLGDGPSALTAWRSYYRIADGVSAGHILDDSGSQLTKYLPDWSGDTTRVEQNIAIARALEASRMYEPASLLITIYIPEDQRPHDITEMHNYGLFIQALAEMTDEYYRETAIGEGDYPAYFKSLLSMLKNLWESGSWSGGTFPIDPPFTTENVMSQTESISVVQSKLLERFGAYIALGQTAGYGDLHYGHVVVDDNRTIEQYSQKAEVRFFLIDNMVSNGFQSWAWDYRSQHGGWANELGIFQVRSAYTGGPMQTWRTLSNPKKVDEQLTRMASDLEEDQQRATKSDIVYLPGVRSQIRHTAQNQLLDRLKAEGLSGVELQKRFVAELTRIEQEYSIFAHEGRHFIDKRKGIDGSEELEFRAKLSEIAFAELPKLALAGGIYSSNLGADTPHGQANKRVMQGIAAWMNSHGNEIDGLDSNKSKLLQLNLLTDDQIRAAVRSIDPLAQRGN